MDRRIFLNERLHTMQITQAAHDLAFYGLRAIDIYRPRVEGYNPTLVALPEETYIRLALGKHALDGDFRKEWKRADAQLAVLMREAKALRHPKNVWKKLLQTFEHATGLPTTDQALGFLDRSQVRIKNLISMKDGGRITSIGWAGMMYVENMILRGGFMGSTFLIPVTEHPVVDKRVDAASETGWRTVNNASLDAVRRN
jgi:hypothetical protein